jgi:trehalose synthase
VPGDIVLLHDPQTAGLVQPLEELGAIVVWRCHIGLDEQNAQTELGWSFLRPYVEPASAVAFSRTSYAPSWIDPARLHIIPPSLDPFSAKNIELTEDDVRASLRAAGIVAFPPDGGSLEFTRRDGSPGTQRHHAGLVVSGPVLPPEARAVVQISRWDHLKDMVGVMTGFVRHLDSFPADTHLVLVGPATAGVTDDPEGAEVLQECIDAWEALPQGAQDRVHLVCLPMDDIDENAHLVNAIQRFAEVAVQKSLAEGFGLTVTEPMWKGRAVLASAVGGIRDQIEDGVSGLLLADPTDLDEFASLLGRLLSDEGLRERLGSAAHERVRDHYLGDRHLIQYAELFAGLGAG